jgi:1-acyl-sn-glycerol-3-phosphate acyltransferase
MVQSLVALVGIATVTVVYSIAVMLHMVVFRDKNVFFLYARSWSRLLLRMAGVRVELVGAEHLDARQRYVYVANHASLFDIPVLLATIPDNIRIMYKRELGRIPVFGWGLRLSPFVPIDRERSRDAAAQLEATISSMATGASVVVFPEGTRSADGTLGAFRRGAFALAARAGRPIVPVVLEGTATILPARSFRLRGGAVRCIILEAMTLPHPPSRADEKQALETVRARMESVMTA